MTPATLGRPVEPVIRLPVKKTSSHRRRVLRIVLISAAVVVSPVVYLVGDCLYFWYRTGYFHTQKGFDAKMRAEIQPRLPAGWEVKSVSASHARGYTLFVSFISPDGEEVSVWTKGFHDWNVNVCPPVPHEQKISQTICFDVPRNGPPAPPFVELNAIPPGRVEKYRGLAATASRAVEAAGL